jgi:hypothetical protein
MQSYKFNRQKIKKLLKYIKKYNPVLNGRSGKSVNIHRIRVDNEKYQKYNWKKIFSNMTHCYA